MKKLLTILTAAVLLLVGSAAAQNPPGPHNMIRINAPGWKDALEIFDVHPAAPAPTVDIRVTNCQIGYPGDTVHLAWGQVARQTDFSATLCDTSGPFGVVPITANNGTAALHTLATFNDGKTTNYVDIPELPDPLPAWSSTVGIYGSDSWYDILRATNNTDVVTNIAFIPVKPTQVTVKVYNSAGKLSGEEYVQINGPTFYTVKTKIDYGRIEIRNGMRDIGVGCNHCNDGLGAVYAVAFIGYGSGGMPRVEVPRLGHTV